MTLSIFYAVCDIPCSVTFNESRACLVLVFFCNSHNLIAVKQFRLTYRLCLCTIIANCACHLFPFVKHHMTFIYLLIQYTR